MEFLPTPLDGVVLIRARAFTDARGSFMETWQEREFAAAGIDARFVQDNHSRSVRHTLRGLHYQIEQPQGKLVRVASGAVYDVAVDLRRSSQSFGRWYGTVLSDENHHMLWVPPGFAHGILVISERAVRWNDPQLAIEWPLAPGVKPLLSEKDAAAPPFSRAEYFA